MACNITSNTAMAHITFIDGLVPDRLCPNGLHSLRKEARKDSTLVIQNVHHIYRKDPNTRLVVANVSVPENVQTAVEQLTTAPSKASSEEGSTHLPSCALPQMPLHISLGYSSGANSDLRKALTMARERLVGKVLSVDVRRLRLLAPLSEDDLGEY
mmetsp:Transcript_18773/g.34818  ORF Transcript_18773/g.34818 Transcript_18773/m.34818 type:complete len:156 (-) Transcript_18773:132-599(-)